MSDDDQGSLLDALGTPCNHCGRCCRLHGGALPLSGFDLERWTRSGSAGSEILRWVDPESPQGNEGRQLWFNPNTDAPWRAQHCPWVRESSDAGYECTIYALRPDACREFPTLAGQIDTICAPGGLDVS